MTHDELRYDAVFDCSKRTPSSIDGKFSVTMRKFERVAQDYLNDESITNKERVALNVVRSSYNKLGDLVKLTNDKGTNLYDCCRAIGILLDAVIDLTVFVAVATK